MTETEVREGLVNIEDQDKHCLWLKRDIDNIEQQESNYALSRYIGKLFTLYSITVQKGSQSQNAHHENMPI